MSRFDRDNRDSGRKCCINCSVDLESDKTENDNQYRSGFYTLNCSSRVRSPFKPAIVELIPIPHALSTIFNFEALEKISRVSNNVSDTDTDRDNNPLKDFELSASTVPICFVCYLVLSDLYRIYTEFSQLRKANSFLGSKLSELEDCFKSQNVHRQKLSSSLKSNLADHSAGQSRNQQNRIDQSRSNNYATPTKRLQRVVSEAFSEGDGAPSVKLEILEGDEDDGTEMENIGGVTDDEEDVGSGEDSEDDIMELPSPSRNSKPSEGNHTTTSVAALMNFPTATTQRSSQPLSNTITKQTPVEAFKQCRSPEANAAKNVSSCDRQRNERVTRRLTRTRESQSNQLEAAGTVDPGIGNSEEVPRKRSRRYKKDYELMCRVSTLEEAREFIRGEGEWVYFNRKGKKIYYRCKSHKHNKCKSGLYVNVCDNDDDDDDSESDNCDLPNNLVNMGESAAKTKIIGARGGGLKVKIYKTTLEHTHQNNDRKNQKNARVRERELPDDVRVAVDGLFSSGTHSFKIIQSKLSNNGMDSHPIKSYVARLNQLLKSEKTLAIKDSMVPPAPVLMTPSIQESLQVNNKLIPAEQISSCGPDVII